MDFILLTATSLAEHQLLIGNKSDFAKMRHLATWLLLACILMLICDAVGTEKKTAKKVAKAVAKAATAGKKTTRFFTAWTIISIVMLGIIMSVVAYYLYMFYPLVCAERGKYDVMEMAHV